MWNVSVECMCVECVGPGTFVGGTLKCNEHVVYVERVGNAVNLPEGSGRFRNIL